MNAWPSPSSIARPSSKPTSRRTKAWSAATDSRIRASIAARSVGRERPRQLEVVVEAVLDGGPDAEAGAREQVQDRLGHDVRRAVAHRVDGGVGARVEQLVRRAALRGLERDLVLVHRGHPASSSAIFTLPRNRKPLVRQDERFDLPRGPEVVGDTGLEPVTSCMSSMRANQLRQSPLSSCSPRPMPWWMASKPAKVAHSTAGVANPADRGSRVTTAQHGTPACPAAGTHRIVTIDSGGPRTAVPRIETEGFESRDETSTGRARAVRLSADASGLPTVTACGRL